MSKRRKRRRLAFINRMREIAKENPNLALEQVKTQTAIEVKNALREADRTAPHSREEHHKVFEDTLFSRNKITSTTTKPTTTTKTTATKTKAAPKSKSTTRAKKSTTKAKSKTTTATKAKKSTTGTTKKRTTTKRAKKVNLPKDTLVG